MTKTPSGPPRLAAASAGGRRDVLALVGIVGVALAMRVPVLASRQLVEGDGVHYASLARQALAGDPAALANPYWSNLWPAAIAGTAVLTGLDVVASGRLASLVFGVGLCIATTLLGTRLFGRAQGALAGFAVAIHPWLVTFSTLVFTESCFAFLVTATLLAASRAARAPGPARAALVGVVAGLGLWTRPEALGVTIVAAGVVAYAAWRRAGARSSLADGAVLLLVAGTFLAVRAAAVRYWFGEWDFGLRYKGTANLFVGLAATDVSRERIVHGLAPSGETRLEAAMRGSTLLGFALEHPGLLIEHSARNLVRLGDAARRVFPPLPVSMGREAFLDSPLGVAIDLAGLACLALAVQGLVQGLRASPTRPGAGMCGGLLLVLMAGLVPLYVHDRMLLTATPLFLLFLAHGCVAVVARLKRFDSVRAALPAAVGVLLLSAAAASLFGLKRAPSLDYASEPVVQRQAGLWLRANFPQEARLMTQAPSIAFYFYDAAHQDQEVDLPWAGVDELMNHARSEQVDVVAAPEWQMQAAGVPSAPQLLPEGSHPGLAYLASIGVPPYAVHVFCVEARPFLGACARRGATAR